MSQAYAQALEKSKNGKIDMRTFLKRPGKRNNDGTIQYFTEQAHKDACDITKIIKAHDRQGVFLHVNKMEARFGDLTGDDFKTMSDKVIKAKEMFGELPSSIRNEFRNSPEELLRFMEDENNRDKAIELGLIDPQSDPSQDGLGEHVKTPPAKQTAKVDVDPPAKIEKAE